MLMGLMKLPSLLSIKRYFCRKAEPAIMKFLNVAEKNDAAKNIAAILSRGTSTRREGYSNYNKIYEFDGTVTGRPTRMVMTSVSGHLLNYEFTAAFKNWQSCNPVALFDAPVVKTCMEDFLKIKRTLEREIRSCQGLIIWTDCDREGENIGFEIIQVCSEVKPNLQIHRAKFSEITGPSVFRALNNLGQPNKNIDDAVNVRQELDLRTGAAFTRLQTLRLQKVFPQKLADKLISYGSCQFPTLGFVVDRYKAIEEFIPEAFWKIKMSHTDKDLKTDFNWKRERLFDKTACESILDICKENQMATVESVESKQKNKWRPLPLDTVEMEKNISRKLKINAKEAMKIAEKLYTQGLISYPRTETNIFPKELNLPELVEQQCEDNRWGPFARRVQNEGGPNPRQGRKTDQAHPPIHPTKYTNALNGNEQRVYEYIVRHFLACVSKDAVGHETVVHVDVADEKFVAKGLVVLEKNYLDVYVYEKWNAKEIYSFRNGDTFMPSELDITESCTSPPKFLTEADLIALMEKHGIGTDATHADHIETIKSRQYVGLHENMYFVPGTLGMGLVEGYNKIGLAVSLAKPNLRAEFERDLKLICDGVKDAQIVRREQIAKYKAVFTTVMERMQLIDESLENRLEERPQAYSEQVNGQAPFKSVLKCPKCGNDMVVKDRKNGQGKYISCLAFPQCKNAVWFSINVESIEVLDSSCSECGPNVKKVKIRFKHNVFPGYPNPNELCIGGCNRNVLETLDISIDKVKKQNVENNNTASNNSLLNSTAVNGIGNQRNLSTWTSNIQSGNTSVRNDSGYNSGNSSSNNQKKTSRSFLHSDSLDLMPGPSGVNRNSLGNNDPGSEVVCSCNQPAILLTVRKEGPNTGRKFYKCAVGQEGGCNFFLWAVDESSSSTNRNMPGNSKTRHTQQPKTLKCNCNLQASLKTVQKEGPNKGRQFYCCPKPMDKSCKFFKWADEVLGDGNDDGDDGGSGGGGGRGGAGTIYYNGSNNTNWKGKAKYKSNNKRSAPYKNQAKAKRKCGICAQEGHVRTKCPNV